MTIEYLQRYISDEYEVIKLMAMCNAGSLLTHADTTDPASYLRYLVINGSWSPVFVTAFPGVISMILLLQTFVFVLQ